MSNMAAANDMGRGGGARPRHPGDAEGPKMPLAQAAVRSVGVLRCIDVMSLLQDLLAILSGGRDRRGGAIITFPSSGRRDKAKADDYRLLLQYLMSIPSDDVSALGFTVIVDMRGNATWNSVKPILKVLQEYFATHIHTAHIIKPDNFWQKQRTSLGSQKYKFETNLISTEALIKVLDPSQLTTDLDGSLLYDHSIWIELRCTLEDFLWQSSDLLGRLDDMREDLNANDFADDVGGAKGAVDLHLEARRKIVKVPVENMDNVGQRLLHRFSSNDASSDSVTTNMAYNPDLQSTIPQIMHLLDQMHSGQQHLLHLWQIKKTKLEQCLQLRIFEQDCEKMFDWIYSNKEAFLVNYVDIGHSYATAKKLQDEHHVRTHNSNTACTSVSRILREASVMLENGHYASSHVRGVANRLETTWKDLATVFDERSTVLALSTLFHQKAEQYKENVPKWNVGCEISAVTTDITTLEATIHQHQTLYETMCQAYTEVHSTSKKLLYQLDHLVQLCKQPNDANERKHDPPARPNAKSPNPPSDPAKDYSDGANHVLSVIHNILAQHRSLESRWHSKKIKLHQRLALRLFQEDVKQVLDWLQNHGEVFLRKNVGIGRNLAKARAYQKSHETFEGVVQNTYTNAEKLLAAAAELAQTGECNAEDIYSVAHELESHISSFAQRVEQRRRLLELSVLFFSHTEELTNWLAELRVELQSEEVAETLEGAERLLEQFGTQRDSTLDACASTIAEGKTLLDELKSQPNNASGDNSILSIQSTLDRLSSQRDELGELWANRKLRLDLCLQLRLFERDALELSSQFEMWSEQLQHGEVPRSMKESEVHLRNLADHISHIQSATYEVAHRGEELVQHFENSGINIMADSQYNGVTRVQLLLEYLQEREMDLEDLGAIRRIKLEQCVQLCQFESDANQVIRWIHSAEGMLAAGFAIPGSLGEAEQLKKEHEQFQTAIEKTHASAVHVRQRSETLLNNNHYDPKAVRDIADGVTGRWQQLVTRAEERHKLVTASLNFYKTAEQVCSVLDSLEREYKRDDDMLQKHLTAGDIDKVTLITQLISKHQEQKEAFLKACTLARRTAETFLKYSNRSLQFFSQPTQSTFKGPEAKVKAILEKLLTQENRVLEYWTTKKKRLDQTQQFCLFERSARQSLAWIKEEGDNYLSTHTSVGKTKEETQALLEEHNSFKEKAKETREKVKLLLQLADTLMEKGHAHAPSIKSWVDEVDDTYKDFSTRMDKYRVKLEAHLGISPAAHDQLSLDRASVSSVDSGRATSVSTVTGSNLSSTSELTEVGSTKAKELNEEKRRSARRREFIMAELLETERSYVKDLESAVHCFLLPMRRDPEQVPSALKGTEDVIFGNVEEILQFHKTIFLKALEKYEAMPEDVGHAFVTWAPKFDSYVKYCTNKPHSTQLLVAHGGQYFESLQRKFGLEHPIAAYLIKPVQRITKYQLLLKDLLSCSSHVDQGEIKEGLEVCLSVPKKANDALHLSMLEGCDVPNETLGEVVMQDSFQVWDPKQIIRKAKDRHIFLFELYLVFAKEVKDTNGKSKYIYKNKLLTADMGITEHIEGDECKFAAWTGRSPVVENKMILKASSIDTKQLWVKKLRELIQETYFNSTLPLHASSKGKTRFSREFEDNTSLDGSLENMERGSIASFGSGNTTDSDHHHHHRTEHETWVLADSNANGPGELSVQRGQQVEVVATSAASNNMVVVRVSASGQEGMVPLTCLKQPVGGFKFRNGGGAFPGEDSGGGGSDKNGGNSTSNSAASAVGLAASKKKGGFGGKWLPNIRKLSQGRGDKALADASKLASAATSASTSNQPGVNSSKQIFKLTKPSPMGNKLSHGDSGEGGAAASTASAADRPPSGHQVRGPMSEVRRSKAGNSEATPDDIIDEQVAEVPPPMEPIAPIPVSNSDKLGFSLETGSSSLLDKPNNSCDSSNNAGGASSVVITADSVEKAIQERSYRLQELLDSERVYVCDLEHCCQYIQYMRESKEKEDPEIPMPEDLRDGKDRMIFGNIEAIYDWHRDNFLKNLESCIDKPIELGNLFKKYDRKFQMYVVYCQNKPKSEYIVSEYIDTYFEEIRLKLGFKLRLTDLLIKPIQRLTKYHMLLEAIVKYSQRAGLKEEAEALSKAFHVMTVVPNQANDMMDIGRLQGFEGKITAQGKLLHRGPLNALDTFSTAGGHQGSSDRAPPKMKPFTCFLFEQIMIFSETVGKKTQFTSPVYVYKAHFLVNKMALDERVEDDDPLKFLIKSNDPARDELRILCQAEDAESKQKWLGILKKQLQTQMDFLRALQAPIAYHNRLAKD